LDALAGADDARALADQHAEGPDTGRAVEMLKQAARLVEKVERLISKAADAVKDTPEFDRVASLGIDAEDMEIALLMQVERMG
jgi:hypothetical protein